MKLEVPGHDPHLWLRLISELFVAKGTCRHPFPVLTRHGSEVVCST